MRTLGALLLLAALAAAQGPQHRHRGGLDEAQRAEVVRVIGAEAWGALPKWRQDVLCDRYARYLRAPDRKREAIERMGLREFLLQSREEPDRERLPPALEETVQRLPEGLRPYATRMAFMRLRQLRLDRGLAYVPAERRWDLFRRLFPEPFDQETASEAFRELYRWQVKGVAARIRRAMANEGAASDRASQARFVREATQEEEARVVERVRHEVEGVAGLEPRRARRFLGLLGLLEDLPDATPRQRELIRYALRPEECPLLDLSYLGPRPPPGPERLLWERDFTALARLELLSEAGFNRETVLHLAGTDAPEDFLRALKALRRTEPSPNRESPD